MMLTPAKIKNLGGKEYVVDKLKMIIEHYAENPDTTRLTASEFLKAIELLAKVEGLMTAKKEVKVSNIETIIDFS